jgi:beta-glucosidase
VTNTGTRTSDEVVELYVKALTPSIVPHHELRAFERVTLAPGEGRTLTFTTNPP